MRSHRRYTGVMSTARLTSGSRQVAPPCAISHALRGGAAAALWCCWPKSGDWSTPAWLHTPYISSSLKTNSPRSGRGSSACWGAGLGICWRSNSGCREGICGSCGFLINGSAGEPHSGMMGQQSMKEAHLAAIACQWSSRIALGSSRWDSRESSNLRRR
jgi:hypothetical protein